MIRTILIDDEPAILEELKQMLENDPAYEVVGAYTDADQALDELAKTGPHCAFLDIELPGINGIELAEVLMKTLPNIEVLFITAYNYYATQAFEVNAVDYILKPVRPERLAKALDRIKLRCLARQQEQGKRSLQIHSFGMFEVVLNGEVVKWYRTKPKELFAYLLQHEGKWVDKYKACDDLWRDYTPDQARANLQTAVWAVRKLLNDAECTLAKITYAQDRYLLTLTDAEWDLREFKQALQQYAAGGPDAQAAGELAEQLYSGLYLQGEDWLWADIERERYDTLFTLLRRKRSSYFPT